MYVEDHLSEAGGSFLPGNRWCPWSSVLTKEVQPVNFEIAGDAKLSQGIEYSGTSTGGNFAEALSQAIKAAKIGLQSDLVKWKITRIEGEDGGFVLKNDLTVTILASVR
jgi:hypothetical protein